MSADATEAQRGEDILFTGPPRSGTTLVCDLLNRVPGTLALDEPLPVGLLLHDKGAALNTKLRQFCDRQRRLVVVEHRVRGQVAVDLPPGTHFSPAHPRLKPLVERVPGRLGDALFSRFGGRDVMVRQGWIEVDRPFAEPFTLVLKDPAGFTAALPTLVTDFKAVAIIRNPLAILASWNTIAFTRRGRMWAAERIEPDLGRRLQRAGSRYDRQLVLLSWFFERYRDCLPPNQILRYEALVVDPRATLAGVTPGAAQLDAQLDSHNRNALYDARLLTRLADRLLQSEGVYWEFYDRGDVANLATVLMP